MRLFEAESTEKVNFRLRDWEKEFSETSSQVERDDLIDEFIDEFLVANGINDILPESFKEALHNHISQLGAQGLKQSNPFLQWLVKFYDTGCSIHDLNNETYNKLNSLYANNVILDKDLRGNGVAKLDSIIFTDDLFKQSLRDMTYLTQVFYWLCSDANTKSLDIDSLSADQAYDFLNILGYNNPAEADRINPERRVKFSNVFLKNNTLRDLICFEDGKYDHHGKLRSAKRIYEALNYLEENDTSNNDDLQDNIYDIKNRKIEQKSLGKYNQLKLNELDGETARDIISLLIKNYKIKL